MSKRGQVTIYIIVGIVILAVFSMIFFFRNELVRQDFQSELKSVVIPEQIKPVKGYIDECIEDTVIRGARVLGSSGGYLEVPEDDIPRSVVNEFSNSLMLGDSQVAYWYYKSANNLDKTQIPTEESMEEDLEKYINENFDFCLDGLEDYLYEGFDITYDYEVDSDVNIEDTHIEVRVFAPTDISLGEVGQYYPQHLADVRNNMGKLYKLALDVYEEENENKFLEEKTIDMMVVYEEIPYSDTEFTCNRKTWSKGTVEDNFKEIVSFNLGALRLKGSDYVQTVEDNDYFEVGVSAPSGITTNFEYVPSWPFGMEVSPSKGELLVGDSITQGNPDISKYMNLFFCLNNYHFVYDVKYPTLISLSDEEGFTFQFANMVVIDKNTPRQFEGEILYYDDSGALGEEFCENKINDIEVLVLDASNMAEVSNVDISYSCMSSSCYLGRTNALGELVDRFPACVNGRIYADKEGYYSVPETLSTDIGSKIGLLVEPYYELDVEVRVIDLISGEERGIESGEEAIFQLRNLDNGYTTMVVSDSEATLIAGEYEVTLYLMQEGDAIKIGGQTFTECYDVPRTGLFGVLGMNKEECFETSTEDSEIEEFVSGGAAFNFDLDHHSLEQGDKIVLYAMRSGTPDNYQDMVRIVESLESNVNNQNFRYPEII
jgi:hypothetical protein